MSLKYKILGIAVLAAIALFAIIKVVAILTKVFVFIGMVLAFIIPATILYFSYKGWKKLFKNSI